MLVFDDFSKKIDYGQKMRFCEKKVGNFSTSKCSRSCAFQKKKILRGTFWTKKPSLKGFCKILNRTPFLTIFVNLRKRLESAVLAGQCKFSVKVIIYMMGFHWKFTLDLPKQHFPQVYKKWSEKRCDSKFRKILLGRGFFIQNVPLKIVFFEKKIYTRIVFSAFWSWGYQLLSHKTSCFAHINRFCFAKIIKNQQIFISF